MAAMATVKCLALRVL